MTQNNGVLNATSLYYEKLISLTMNSLLFAQAFHFTIADMCSPIRSLLVQFKAPQTASWPMGVASWWRSMLLPQCCDFCGTASSRCNDKASCNFWNDRVVHDSCATGGNDSFGGSTACCISGTG